ncbi:MAG TPA: TIGR02996 domain-containing protein, partial [Kofleriaceae bacterium]
MDSTITSLENALAASRDEDWRIALGHLLAAWQITPAREVLAAFDAVDPRARETTWTVAGRDPDELAHAWLHAITDADAALFSVLCDNFEACGRGQHVRMLAAARRMASHPRFGELLVRRLKRRARRLHGYWSPLPENLAYWPPFEAAAHASRDPRVPELLREYEDANGRVDRHAVPPPIAWPTLDDRSRAICARIVELAPRLRTKRDRDLAAHAMLLEAIYQAPGDPGPKLAFADFLQQRGDPRGELVALQLTASPGRWLKRTRQRRMDAILQTFWRDLKAPAPITAGVVFRGGFPARIRMAGPLGNEPAWRLIRSADEAPIGELSMPLL